MTVPSDAKIVAALEKRGGLTNAEARCVLEVYRKMGILKRAHDDADVLGAYLDRKVIRHALASCKRIDAAKKKKK